MTASIETCPACGKDMELEGMDKRLVFREVDIRIKESVWVCHDCNIEVGSVDQTAALQKDISAAYRKAVGLLTSEEIWSQTRRNR